MAYHHKPLIYEIINITESDDDSNYIIRHYMGQELFYSPQDNDFARRLVNLKLFEPIMCRDWMWRIRVGDEETFGGMGRHNEFYIEHEVAKLPPDEVIKHNIKQAGEIIQEQFEHWKRIYQVSHLGQLAYEPGKGVIK